MTDGTSEKKVTVNDPASLASFHNKTDGTSIYFVGQYNNGRVAAYDGAWQHLFNIGGFAQVTTLLISPKLTLWAMDRSSYFIKEYSLDGTFIRTVVSGVSGLESMSMHPNHPNYVWIAAYTAGGLDYKRYQVYSD